MESEPKPALFWLGIESDEDPAERLEAARLRILSDRGTTADITILPSRVVPPPLIIKPAQAA
jgi:hypothetical protein